MYIYIYVHWKQLSECNYRYYNYRYKYRYCIHCSFTVIRTIIILFCGKQQLQNYASKIDPRLPLVDSSYRSINETPGSPCDSDGTNLIDFDGGNSIESVVRVSSQANYCCAS